MLLRLHKVISTTSSHQPAHASAMPLSSGGRTGHRGASRDTRRAERRPHLRSDSLGGELDGAAHAHTGSRRCEHPAARANPAPAAGRTLLTLAVPQAGEATPTNRAFFASAADSSAEPLPALRQPLCSGTHFFFFPLTVSDTSTSTQRNPKSQATNKEKKKMGVRRGDARAGGWSASPHPASVKMWAG